MNIHFEMDGVVYISRVCCYIYDRVMRGNGPGFAVPRPKKYHTTPSQTFSANERVLPFPPRLGNRFIRPALPRNK